jgi:hypothetical protein
MKTFLFFVFLFVTMTVKAYVVPTYRDLKPATQIMIEKQDFGTPAAAGTADILSANAGTVTTSAAKTVSTFLAQPDVPRNLVITPAGTTTDVESCVIVVSGTNYFGRAISENFTFAANASTATTGSKAFKTVSSVVFPVDCESGGFGATWSVGFGEKIGLKRCMDFAGFWAWSTVGGAYETTRATIAADADEVEKNTADFNGSMDDSTQFYGFFHQNFRCLP